MAGVLVDDQVFYQENKTRRAPNKTQKNPPATASKKTESIISIDPLYAYITSYDPNGFLTSKCIDKSHHTHVEAKAKNHSHRRCTTR